MKTKVVIDTNVIISGVFWNGVSSKIISLIDENKITMIASIQIIYEYERVANSEELLEKTDLQQQAVMKNSMKIMQKAHLVEPRQKFTIIKEDPDDDKFLDAAVEGKVKYIISNDNHLLRLKEFEGIKIVTPEEFLKLIR